MMTSFMDSPHAFGLHVANFEIPMSLITSLTRPCTFPALVHTSSSPKLWKSEVGQKIIMAKLGNGLSIHSSEIFNEHECTFLIFCHLYLNNSKELCFLFSGECKCLAGFKGRHCEMPCDRGRYGIGCSYRCNCVHANSDGCDPISGKCLCKPGWKGKFRVK